MTITTRSILEVPARILWVVKGLGPGGAERLLCAQARAHDRSIVEPSCCFVLPEKDHLAEELERAGVRTTCLSRSNSDVLWPWRLMKLIRTGAWDIIHVHSPLPGSVARLAVRSLPSAKRPRVVTTEHNQSSTFHWMTRWLNALTSRGDDATIAVSHEVQMSLWGGVRKRAETLRHGIDVAEVSKQRQLRDSVRTEFDLTDDEFVVGTVANFRPQKDYPNLLAAMKLLADRKVAFRLLAVGQGPDEAEIRAQAERLDLGLQVIFTGFRDDATAVMGGCDAFVLASQWEGLPVALMEATALGLPIVATEVGGVAEELTTDENCILVPPKNPEMLARAIELLASDPEHRRRLGSAAKTVAARFDVKSAVRRLEEVYQGLLIDRRPISEGQPTVVSSVRLLRTRRAGLGEGLTMRLATADDRGQILELCRSTLGWGDDPRFEQLFRWKHDLNPFGSSLVSVAVDGPRVVGLRSFMYWNLVRGRQRLRTVRAVDTVTHEDFQGRGIFTALTMHSLEVLHDQGIDFVFNTPNQQSRPGYLKMGWTDVGRVPVAVRVTGPRGFARLGRSRVAASHWPVETSIGSSVDSVIEEVLAARDSEVVERSGSRVLRTEMSDEFLRWRYAQSFLDARALRAAGGFVIVQFRSRGTATECLILDSFGVSAKERDRVAIEAARDAGADYVVRSGLPSWGLGFVPVYGMGPRLTWRGIAVHAMPALGNWDLSMGTVALF